MISGRTLMRAGLLAVAACGGPAPTPRVVALEPPPDTTVEAHEPAIDLGSYFVARIPAELGEGLWQLAMARPDVSQLLRGCDVDLATVKRLDVAVTTPTAIYAEVIGGPDETALSCVVDALGLSQQIAVTASEAGVVVNSVPASDAARRVFDLLDARGADESYATLALGRQPTWTLELTIDGEDIDLSARSTPEAVAQLVNWWQRAKAKKSAVAPAIESVELVPKGDRVSLVIGGDGWDDVGKSIALALAVRRHVIESWKVPSGSMLPSLVAGDHFFVDKTRPPATHGDVIVFPFPENPAQGFVKRIIAMPGDRLEVLDGRPILNGELLPHCYVGRHAMPGAKPLEIYLERLGDRAYLTGFDARPAQPRCSTDRDCSTPRVCRAERCGLLQGPFVAKEGEAWVLGDNRNNSYDSRAWDGGRGAGIPLSEVVGRAELFYFNPQLPERPLTRVHDPRLPTANAETAARLKRCLDD
jgi:signal peptidase I